MLTNAQLKEIQEAAYNDARDTWDDTSTYARTPWVLSDPNPADSLIGAEGVEWICGSFNLADWETDGGEFCEVYNKAFVSYWDSLCK